MATARACAVVRSWDRGRAIVRRQAGAFALALWCVPLLFVALRSALGLNHVDSWCVYAAAVARWHARQPLYDTGIDGFQYLPQATLVFAPFAALGHPLGDIAWRAASWALFGQAVWRSARLVAGASWPTSWLIASALCLGPSLSSLSSGQANLATAALMLQATAALAERRDGQALLWMTLGLAVKPLMAVLMLLACVLRPRLAPRVALGVVLVALVPFALAPPDYVLAQCRGWLAKLAASSQPDRLFEDLRGLASRCGWDLSHAALRVVRGIAALGALALVREIGRRRREPEASFLVFAVAASYLMLFNPRTQPNSYVILVPAVALAAAVMRARGRRRAFFALVLITASWCCGMLSLTLFWLRPLTAIVFAALTIHELLGQPPTADRAAVSSDSPAA